MRLTLFFLIAGTALVTASGSYSQTTFITLNKSNITLKEALDEIEQQSEFIFFYKAGTLDETCKVDIQVKNQTIEKILDKLFKDTEYSYYIDDRQVFINKKSSPTDDKQQKPEKKKITGKIVDRHGDPLVGASIVEKNTNNGIISNIDGQFSLEVAENALLTISYLGYISREVSTARLTNLNITLEEENLALNEVVVVGYGTQKKVNLTGAVAHIKGDVLENRSVTNLAQALQGQVANLNIAPTNSGGEPGADLSVNIRGYTGFGSSGTPLIVIDGIQGGSLSNVDMNDVESISVLKDAASAAIYGSNAPYGVLLITTKKGKQGQKPTITYSNNFGWAQPINLPKMMNSLDFALYRNEAAFNSGNSAPYFSDEVVQLIKDYQAGIIDYEIVKNPAPDTDSWGTSNANNDWFDIFFKDFSFSQRHNAGISGGIGNSNYYVGLGYYNQGGMYEYGHDTYDRYNIRANLTSNVTKWMTFSFRGSFSQANKDAPNVNGAEMNFMNEIGRAFPTWALYNPDGTFNNASPVLRLNNGGRNKETGNNAVLTGEFVFQPLAGWEITANYSYDLTYTDGTQHVKTIYYSRPSGTLTPLSGTTPNSFTRYTRKNIHNNINVYSSYEKSLSDHYFKILAGYTQELFDNVSLSAGNNYLYSDDIPSIALSYGTLRSISESASQLAIRGGFGRFNYNYKEKYLFEFNGRYDGTSRFLSDVRYKFYPGISAAWVASNEKFWEQIKSNINFLKLRVEYGSLGDQGFTGNYPFYPSLGKVSPTSSNWIFSGGRESNISSPGIINSALTWVTTTTLDFGTDLAFFSNRLNVSFDWYNRYMNDYVGPSEALPAILGTSAPQTNSAAMKTSGWELTVGWKHLIGELSYGVNAVLSDYWGEITKYPNPNGLRTTWYEGQKMGEIWGYETVGFFQSDEEIANAPSQSKLYNRWTKGDIRYKDQNNDGIIDWGSNTLDDPGDMIVIGNSTPRYSFGVNINAEYKGFDIAVFFQGVAKRDIVFTNNTFAGFFWGITGDQWHSSAFVEHADRWSEENPNAYFPKYYLTSAEMTKNMQPQTKYMQNAAYMRVKNLQLGYTIPSALIQKYCEKIRIFANVENLATVTKMFKPINPELSTLAGTWGWVDGKIYPLQRTWACGINITF
ncbi:MAG: TonB-dependent receptor [Dysgonamonadaceae bacterium]|nr:TonB-dependent receptor [Dysgonamonadaceae bacterium]